MTLKKYIDEFGFEEKQKQVLEQFFIQISWIEKEFSVVDKINHKDLMKNVSAYARDLFNTRELFITAINLLIHDLIDSDLIEVKVIKNKRQSNLKLLCQVDKIYDSIEFKVKLLKFLQGKKEGIRREEIARYFNVSEYTIGKRLLELQSTENHILGTKVKIELKRKTNSYNSTVHPIFLALNLSEVYTLLGILIQQEPSISGGTARSMTSDIVSQLTDYAKDILKDSGIDLDKYSTNDDRSFRNESKNLCDYLMKTGKKIILHRYGDVPPLVGKLTRSHEIGDCYLFKTENGDLISLESSEIKAIIESDSKESAFLRP